MCGLQAEMSGFTQVGSQVLCVINPAQPLGTVKHFGYNTKNNHSRSIAWGWSRTEGWSAHHCTLTDLETVAVVRLFILLHVFLLGPSCPEVQAGVLFSSLWWQWAAGHTNFGGSQPLPFSFLEYSTLFSADQVLSRCSWYHTTFLFFHSFGLSGLQVVVSFLGWRGLWTALQPKALWTGKGIWVHQFWAHWSELCL